MDKLSWSDVISKFLEKTILVFLALGVLLLILAVIDVYSKFGLNTPNQTSLLIMGITGGTLILVAIIGFLRGEVHNASNGWIKRKYGLKIHSPEGGPFQSPIPISGSFKKQPPEQQVYAIVFNPDTRQFWPKEPIVCNPEKKTWRATIHIGNGDNRTRRLVIAYLGENSMKLIDYFNLNVQLAGRATGMKKFPKDFIVLDTVEIVALVPSQQKS